MKNCILLLFLFLNFSCSPSNFENELTDLLTKDGGYWDYEWLRNDADQHGFTFKFEKNGNLTKYSFNKAKNERRLFSDYPSSEIDDIWKWKIIGDSLMFMLSDSSKITRYNEDTIYLEKDVASEKIKVIMVRVKGDLNIVK